MPEPITFVSLDVETGGLDPRVHALTEVAFAVFDYTPGRAEPQFKTTWNRFVRPAPELAVTPKALEVQGKTFDEVMRGESEPVVFRAMAEFIRPWLSMPFVGHKVDFDMGFLQAFEAREEKRAGASTLISGENYHNAICTKKKYRELFWLDATTKKGTGFSLDDALATFGMKRNGTAHGALEDAMLTARLYCALLETERKHFAEEKQNAG